MIKPLIPLIAVGLSLSACSNTRLMDMIPDNRPNYKTSTTINPLEIPPDLTRASVDDSLNVSELKATDNASLAAYQGERGAKVRADRLAASLKNIKSNGDVSWIEINEQPAVVFKNAKRFWLNNGLALSRVDPDIGIMETDWLQNEANTPSSGISAWISGFISGLHDDGVRDKFRTRIDFDGQRSYVYVTHYGATEEQLDKHGKIIRNNATKSSDPDNTSYTWVSNSRNPELEIEMLRRLNLYLHKTGKQAAAVPKKQGGSKASLVRLNDGSPALVINDGFNQAWMRLGVAIDRAGFEISAQNRRGGLYTFAKITERKVGFILTEIERDVQTYQLGLADQGSRQIAVIRSVNGKAPTPEQAQAILQAISKEVHF